jgi:hypothetical protein
LLLIASDCFWIVLDLTCFWSAPVATDGTWPQVFELADAHTVETEVYSEGGTTSLSDGIAIWWAASQLGSTADSLQPMPPLGLADEALNEWLQFFAGHATRRRRASE